MRLIESNKKIESVSELYNNKIADVYMSNDKRVEIKVIKNQRIGDFVFNDLSIINYDFFMHNRGIATKSLDEFRSRYASQYKNLYGIPICEGTFFYNYAIRNKLQSKRLEAYNSLLIFRLN